MYLALKTLTEGECCTWTGKLFQINIPEYWKERLYTTVLEAIVLIYVIILKNDHIKNHVITLALVFKWC